MTASLLVHGLNGRTHSKTTNISKNMVHFEKRFLTNECCLSYKKTLGDQNNLTI